MVNCIPFVSQLFRGDKWETCALQNIFHLTRYDPHQYGLHLLSISDVAERRVVIGVSGTRHDIVRRRLRLAEHGEIRVPHAVKVEIMELSSRIRLH